MIQGVVDQLRREGFVYVNGRRGGTYVSPHPPHLYHYAVIFPDSPSGDHRSWSRFYQAMANEAAAMEREGERRFFPFYGIDGHAENEQFHLLTAAMRDRRYAGLIFACPPPMLWSAPLMTEPGMPRVAALGSPPNVPGLRFLPATERALDYFAQRGRKKVAMVTNAAIDHSFITPFLQGVKTRGMYTRPDWAQEVSLNAPHAARRLVHLLLNPHQAERPDALFVTDDNLVEYATAGIVDAGVKTPELDVVGHCNFPWPTPSVVMLRRLGYDMRQVLEMCVRCIDEQRTNPPGPPGTPGHPNSPPTLSPLDVHPLFEDELPKRPTTPPPTRRSSSRGL